MSRYSASTRCYKQSQLQRLTAHIQTKVMMYSLQHLKYNFPKLPFYNRNVIQGHATFKPRTSSPANFLCTVLHFLDMHTSITSNPCLGHQRFHKCNTSKQKSNQHHSDIIGIQAPSYSDTHVVQPNLSPREHSHLPNMPLITSKRRVYPRPEGSP